ncbi:MAG: hypothetical protein QGI78_07105 [Phycisphaerales bacterium]|nr:hypothetical protein [Phycisphaerales bacterium]
MLPRLYRAEGVLEDGVVHLFVIIQKVKLDSRTRKITFNCSALNEIAKVNVTSFHTNPLIHTTNVREYTCATAPKPNAPLMRGQIVNVLTTS